jgi:LysR family transcriptional activator of nhaA
VNQTFSYRHLYYFWVVAKEGGLARAASRLDMAIQTISAQVRELEKALGVALLRPQGRNLVLTDAGVVAMREADQIFALGEKLPERVREAASGQVMRLNVGITDGIDKQLVRQLLAPVLGEPQLRLLCHEGEYEQLLAELMLHKLDAVLADRAPSPNPALRVSSQLLATCALVWYAPAIWVDAASRDFPGSLATVPVLLPTHHAAVRSQIDHWLEREHVNPNLSGEFEDSAMLTMFAASGMGVFPAPELLRDDMQRQHQMTVIGPCGDVCEQLHLVYPPRKLMHPMVARLIEASRLVSSSP